MVVPYVRWVHPCRITLVLNAYVIGVGIMARISPTMMFGVVLALLTQWVIVDALVFPVR